MKNVFSFLIFIIYSTSIFFLPNNKLISIFVLINLLIMFTTNVKVKKVLLRIFRILPFIIFTFIINCLLDNYINAIWIGIKLIIVCNITIMYFETTSVSEIAEIVSFLCKPLKIFKINPNEIRIMVCISLSMLPILIQNLHEIKEACVAKNISFNIKNSKIILSKFLLSNIDRINKIEESLIAKGYENE